MQEQCGLLLLEGKEQTLTLLWVGALASLSADSFGSQMTGDVIAPLSTAFSSEALEDPSLLVSL